MASPFGAALSRSDDDRLAAAVDRLRGAGLHGFALTGGTAIAHHMATAGTLVGVRPLNDLDLVVGGPDDLPPALGRAFLVSHVHFDARPGRMLLQLVERERALRIDIFGAFGGQVARSRAVPFDEAAIAVVGPSDLVCRLTALVLDLGEGEAVAAKHARDLLALRALADPGMTQAAWQDHRRPRHPTTFIEARQEAERLIRERHDLLVEPRMSRLRSPCLRCEATDAFVPADPRSVSGILGYA